MFDGQRAGVWDGKVGGQGFGVEFGTLFQNLLSSVVGLMVRNEDLRWLLPLMLVLGTRSQSVGKLTSSSLCIVTHNPSQAFGLGLKWPLLGHSISFLICSSDVPPEEEVTFDLFAISNVNRQTAGVKLFRGPDRNTPAFRFSRFDQIPAASSEKLQEIVRLMQYQEGFILVASLRQDRKSQGTLLAIEGPGYKRQLEIISNGLANTLDFQYSAERSQNLVSFQDVDIADSQWKNITIHVNGENAYLYVGCELADSFILDDPFYEQLTSANSKLYVAKGLTPGKNFKVCIGICCIQQSDCWNSQPS